MDRRIEMYDITYAGYKKLLESFSQLKLSGMKGFELQKLLSVPLEGVSQRNVILSVKSFLIWAFKTIFFSKYKVQIKDKGSVVLLFSNCYEGRWDHKKRMEKLWDYLEDCRLISYEKRTCIPNVCALFRLIYIPIWWVQIGNKVKQQEKLFLIVKLLEALEEKDSIVKVIHNADISGFIVYCDAHITDNLLVQYYKKKSVTTATLQHAYIVAMDDDAHEYLPATQIEGFVSDLFFVQGEEAKVEAIKNGIDSNRLFVAGGLEGEVPKYFGHSKKGIFGVTLCVKEMQRHNEELMSIANKISEKYDLRYIIRLHPSIMEEDISDFINDKYLVEIENPSETIDEYVKKVDFSITGKSTLFSQLLQRNHPTFQFIDSEGKGIYPSLNWGFFSTISQFNVLYEKFLKDSGSYFSQLEEASQYLINSVGVQEKYSELVRNHMRK